MGLGKVNLSGIPCEFIVFMTFFIKASSQVPPIVLPPFHIEGGKAP